MKSKKVWNVRQALQRPRSIAEEARMKNRAAAEDRRLRRLGLLHDNLGFDDSDEPRTDGKSALDLFASCRAADAERQRQQEPGKPE